MTVSVITGLCLQAIAIFLVHVAIHGEWLRRPAAILLLAAVLGHGLTEVMQSVWPGRNPFFRRFVSQATIDDWVLLASAAILVYAAAYVLTLRLLDQRSTIHHVGNPLDHIAGLRLRWVVSLMVPLLIATFQGRGALQPVAPGQVASRDNYAVVGLAGAFLVPLVSIVGVIVLVRYGTRWLVLLFVLQGALLSLAGTRSMIVTACLLSLFGARLCGVRPSRGQVAWMVIVVAFFTMLISSTRAVAGRETFLAGKGAGERIAGLAGGIEAMPSKQSREAILNDLVYRFDSNTFGSLILKGLNEGIQPVGLETMRNNVMFVVPSFVDSEKTSGTLESRSEESFLDRRFGLSQYVDWLPGLFGAMVAYFGPAGLILLVALLGISMAVIECFCLQLPSVTRFLLAMGLTQSALLYAAGPQSIFITMRAALLLVGLAALAGAVERMHMARKLHRASRQDANF